MPKVSKKKTPQQEDNYRQILKQLLDLTRSEDQYYLKLAYNRGILAREILENPSVFGSRKITEIAQDLGIKQLTLKQCIKFSQFLSKDTVEELCKMKFPPSWRLMSRWTNIKDEAVRTEILNKILSGSIDSSSLEPAVRSAIGLSATPKPKKPKRFSTLVKKLNNEADVLSRQLKWVQEELQNDKSKAKEIGSTIDSLANLNKAIKGLLETINR